MLTAEDNDLLCRVEGDAPMGRLMRGHWIPACLSEEVAERDGAPVRVRLLGEELVAFRDTAGRLGVLDEHCPHRRASLVLGRNEECGLRCLYHGWKIDVDGNIVERPSEPPSKGSERRDKHRTYPRREAGGFVWVWMGDPAAPAPFLPPAWAPAPGLRTSIVKMHVNCNWAQVLEGAIDSAHSSSLHATDMVPVSLDVDGTAAKEWRRPSLDKAPRLQVERTAFGFRYVAIRHPIENAATHDYLRITLFVAPFTVLIPPNPRYNLSILNIPQDDTHTMFYFIAWSEGEGIDQDEWRKFCGATVGVDLDAQYRNIRTRDNRYLQDRRAMRRGQPHRHRRHPEPGHGDVGDDGADRRPVARAARRERRRHRAVPPDHGRGRAHGARRTAPRSARVPPRCPCRAALVRRHRAEDHRLEDARRDGEGSDAAAPRITAD